MDNDYIIQLITKLDGSKTADDLKKIEQQLNAKGINLKTSLDTATSKQQLQELAKQLQSVLKSSGLEIDTSKIMSAFSQVTKEADKLAQNVNKIQHLSDTGSFAKQVSDVTVEYNKLSAVTDDLKTDFTELQRLQTALGTSQTDEELISNYEKFNTTLEKVKNSMHVLANEQKQAGTYNSGALAEQKKIDSLAESVLKFRDNNTKMSKDLRRQFTGIYDSLINGTNLTEKEVRELSQEFTNLKLKVRETGQLGQSFGDKMKNAFRKFSEWGFATGIVTSITSKFREAITEIKELDSILTEISKTSDLTKEQLRELGDMSFESASKLGRTATDYLTAVQEMSRSGFVGNQAEGMAEQSLLAQTAGDLDAELANTYVLATNAAYKFNGEVTKLNAVLDGQNSITNRNSVAMADMATAMSEAGTVASSYRVSVEDLSAMIGTIEAVTKLGGSEVGNGIKSILINLQNISSSKITGTLDKANASMTELVNGTEQLRDPISILRDLAVTFNTLEESDPLRAEILTNIGGKYQATKLAALLQNMELFDKMLVDYSEGSGSAMVEAEKSANNLEGSLNKLSNTWTDIVNNIINSDLMIDGVNFFNTLLTGVNNLTDALGGLGTVGLGAGLFAGFKNVGEGKMLPSICFE